MNRNGLDGRLSIRVLYIHHAGAFGGASRSLLELIEGFPPGSVTPRLVSQRGSVARIFAERGIEVVKAAGISQFDNTRFNHYRGRRWIVLLREAYYLPFTLLAILRARSRWKDIDLVHANEVVALAAVFFAKFLFRRPVIVHVRSVQDTRHDRLRSRFIWRVLRRYADTVIAIDETVRRSLPPRVAAEVVHNTYSPRSDRTEASPADPQLPPRSPGSLRVAMVGSPFAFKGVTEFVEAAHLCRERGLAVEFLMVGISAGEKRGNVKRLLKAAGFTHDAGDEVRRQVELLGLKDSVHLLGFTPDIDRVFRNIDVLCFPSHLDAVGRPVIEAAFWKVPSIVAVRDPQPDTMIHRKTGLCIEPGDPQAIAEAVSYFCLNRSEVTRMGAAAHRLALENFDSRKNAARVLDIYLRALAANSAKGPP
ncbi:MAG TPA: glycosyltransferase family 4 protein [Burkholderiales bacterium]|nr:glycosyltransferase family 4 protein [Burkholderiales bacterium]